MWKLYWITDFRSKQKNPSVRPNSYKSLLHAQCKGKITWAKRNKQDKFLLFLCLIITARGEICISLCSWWDSEQAWGNPAVSQGLWVSVTHLHSAWSRTGRIPCYTCTQSCRGGWCRCGRTPARRSTRQYLQGLKGGIRTSQAGQGALRNQQSSTTAGMCRFMRNKQILSKHTM